MYQQIIKLDTPIKQYSLDIEAIAGVPAWLSNCVDYYALNEEFIGVSSEITFDNKNFERYKGYRHIQPLKILIETTFIRSKNYLIPTIVRMTNYADKTKPIRFDTFINETGFSFLGERGWSSEYVGTMIERRPYINLYMHYFSNMLGEYANTVSIMDDMMSPLVKSVSPFLVNINLRRSFDSEVDKAQMLIEGSIDKLVHEYETYDESNLYLIWNEMMQNTNNIKLPGSTFINQLTGRPINISEISSLDKSVIANPSPINHRELSRKRDDLYVLCYKQHDLITELVRSAYEAPFDKFMFHAYITNRKIIPQTISCDVKTAFPILSTLKDQNDNIRLETSRSILISEMIPVLDVILSWWPFNNEFDHRRRIVISAEFDEIMVERHSNDIIVVSFYEKGRFIEGMTIDMLSYMFVYFV